MKNFIKAWLIVATIISNITLFGACGCGLETEIPKHISRLVKAYEKKYTDDSMVQAIVKHDIEHIQRCSINPHKRLSIEVQEARDKVVCECDYIGLTFATMMQHVKQPTQKDLTTIHTIVELLLKKGVARDGSYEWTPYEYKKGRWIRRKSTTGTNKEFIDRLKTKILMSCSKK